jgi:hypothetical protein
VIFASIFLLSFHLIQITSPLFRISFFFLDLLHFVYP